MNDNSEFIPLEDGQGAWRNGAIRLPEKDGTTCLAWLRTDDTKGFRRTFVKQLRPELREQTRYRALFYKEYEVGARLSSVHFPAYYGLEESADGDVAISMEYVEGMTLAEVLESKPERFKTSEDIRWLMLQMAEALQSLHASNVLHLDLKPENIIITSHTGNVMLVDLGFAFSSEWPGTMGRTLSFAAPEQKSGDTESIGPHTDIYSVGTIAEHVAKKCGIVLPENLTEIISRCGAERISDRYARVEDVTGAMAAALPLRKKYAARKLGAYFLVVCALIIAGVALAARSGVEGTRQKAVGAYYALVSDRTFTRDTLCYRVLSWTEATVEVIHGDNYDILGDANIPSVVNDGHRDYVVQSIGDFAFRHCEQLLSVVFPPTLERIGTSAFAYCKKLSTINLPDGFTTLGDSAFTCCSHLREIRIPATVATIPVRCFSDCTPGLRSVSLPRGVTTLERDAFCGSHRLRRVKLPEGLTTIDRGVFWCCTDLDSVVIPSTVVHFGDFCFQGCDSLHTMTVLNPKPVETTNILAEKGKQPDLDFYVPKASIKLYQETFPWSQCRIRPQRLVPPAKTTSAGHYSR